LNSSSVAPVWSGLLFSSSVAINDSPILRAASSRSLFCFAGIRTRFHHLLMLFVLWIVAFVPIAAFYPYITGRIAWWKLMRAGRSQTPAAPRSFSA
jgi:hypothetical protein